MDGFYYKGLNREEKSAYEQMLAGFKSLAPTIRITRLEPARLAEVYLRLKLDTPLLFYVTGYSYRFYPGAEHVELLPEYLFDKGKIRTHQQAIAARIERLTRPLRGKSQLEKEIAIHDFILDSVRYDKLKKSYSHEIIGPLTQGVGVCEGIAKTVKALYHRPQRGKPGKGSALPSHLECTYNRRKTIPYGCYLRQLPAAGYPSI